jgi:hypothetical protein
MTEREDDPQPQTSDPGVTSMRYGSGGGIGNADYDMVPGRNLPGRGIMVRCRVCGYTGRRRRWKRAARATCPKCRKGKLERM